MRLTSDDFTLITADLGFNNSTGLSLANISKINRQAYFAKKLKISVDELISLKQLSGIDPFAAVIYQDGNDFTTIEMIRLYRAG